MLRARLRGLNTTALQLSHVPHADTLCSLHRLLTTTFLPGQGMKEGGKRTLMIPSALGYGKRGAGREIPPNSDLTFDVQLVRCK